MKFSTARPLVMHIDLNSCFATIEQQSRPLLRHRPVAIANRATENTSIVTASYEAKALGIKTGMHIREARRLAPKLVVVESDPPKYKYVYHKLLAIMQRYSASVEMKSIDEGVIDFSESTPDMKRRDLLDVGHEIKQALRNEVGDYMLCNIGIGPNRWWAKTAAGLDKPDGMNMVTQDHYTDILSRLTLRDLTGIAHANEARLNSVGIMNPLAMYNADKETLEKVVFKSIEGAKWFTRLRGYEVDKYEHAMKRVGRQYVLEDRNLSREKIEQRLHTLCESVGERMRRKGYSARGVYVYVKNRNARSGGTWHDSHLYNAPIFSNAAIFATAEKLFRHAPEPIHEIGVHVYKLSDGIDKQLRLFGDELAREQAITNVIDTINTEWGERTIKSASTVGTDIGEKIPFGSTRHL